MKKVEIDWRIKKNSVLSFGDEFLAIQMTIARADKHHQVACKIRLNTKIEGDYIVVKGEAYYEDEDYERWFGKKSYYRNWVLV